MKINSFNLTTGIPAFCLLIAIMLISAPGHSQGVSINETNTTPDPSAMLDVQSNEKGVLVPRMTQAQRNAIANPAAGLLIYQTNQTPGFYFNAGTPALPNWQPVGYNTIWKELGNDIYRFDGNVGFGTTTPNYRIHVNNGNIYATTSSFAIRGIKTGTGTFPGVWGDTESTSSNATGVRGNVTSTTPGSGSAGVHGRNFGTGINGIGVKGTHDGGGWGVYGETVSGRGVYGYATSSSGTTYGVYGRSDSPGGVGVYGYNLSPDGTAGQFIGRMIAMKLSTSSVTDASTTHTALLAESIGYNLAFSSNRIGGKFYADNNNLGCLGIEARAIGINGVGGRFFGDDFAGVFWGDVGINGTLYGGSDAKLKRNITKVENILEKISQVQAYSYDYRTDEYDYMNLAKGRQFGFIAQEIEEIFPELVRDIHNHGSDHIDEQYGIHYEAVDYKGINYLGLIPVITEAIKEQQDIITSQQNLINELLMRISKLEQQIEN
jgi:hypothetical protein